MKIKKEQLIPIIIVVLGLILVIVGVILLTQNKDSEQNNNNNTQETLAKEYFCTRELSTDEYEMKSEYHIYADDPEKDKSNPVVDAGDQMPEIDAEQESDQRHQRLKASEIRAADQHMAVLCLRDRQSLTDGYRERVHRQSHCDNK